MHGGNRYQTRLAKSDQRLGHELRRQMRFSCIGRFFQIEAGAKGLARAAQNEDALVRLVGRDFDRGDQLIKQLDGKGVASLGTIERHHRDLRCLFFDENNGHGQLEIQNWKPVASVIVDLKLG